MLSSEMGLLQTNVSEERVTFIFRVEEITQSRMEATNSYGTSVYNKPTCRHIPEEGIFHSHCRENLKSYIMYKCSPIWTLIYVSFKHISINLTNFMVASKLYENIIQHFVPQ
jgi:hypothetical protein